LNTYIEFNILYYTYDLYKFLYKILEYVPNIVKLKLRGVK